MDFYILDYIQSHFRSDFLDWFMPRITAFGNVGIFWIALTALLLVIPKTRRLGLIAVLSLVIEALCCNVILKPLVARVRPYDINLDISLLISPPTDFSFPSGHTGSSFAVISALFFGKSSLWIPAAVLGVLISFSRLYLYVHYPTDVLAGAIIGIISGWVAAFAISHAMGLCKKRYDSEV